MVKFISKLILLLALWSQYLTYWISDNEACLIFLYICYSCDKFLLLYIKMDVGYVIVLVKLIGVNKG